MVKDQAEHVDGLECTITKSKERTKQALNEIRMAGEYQKSGRKRLCMVALGFAAIGLLSAFYVFRDSH